MPLLDVSNLTTRFHTRNGIVHAVEDVSFPRKGETIGIVGESGSGKSVTCYSLIGLIPKPPGKIHSGKAIFDGIDLLKAPKTAAQIRGKRISMIFQDPMTSLNPYLKISTQLTEPLEIHDGIKGKQALHRAIDALAEVGIPEPEKRIDSYPHEFSGGMRQRVMIAMALITRPELLICDEPTTALDVTVQKQVLDLIKERQQRLGTAVILITHDLAVVHQTCDRVNVMYAGRLIERAATEELVQLSPARLHAGPVEEHSRYSPKRARTLYTIPGMPPDLSHGHPAGCAFHERNTLGDASKCLTDSRPITRRGLAGPLRPELPGLPCRLADG